LNANSINPPLPDGVFMGVVVFDLAVVAEVYLPTDVIAVTVVDTRTENTFYQLTPELAYPGWERVLSSDIKLYRQTFASGATGSLGRRAYLGYGDIASPDPDLRSGPLPTSIRRYTPTQVEIDVPAAYDDSFLVLSDSYYPGWRATVNGVERPIYRANVNFRAIELPSGESRVIFEYDPAWYPGIFLFGGAAWAIAGITCIVLWRRRPNDGRRQETAG
ncbi:MAG: YfhO family protein, partial [Chloroflexota bacterium]